uniref:mitochondrial fission factor homolog A-like isoform X2 n=1 Tax=Myxine glutinosa TaxID=7769 RepID=UPI00358F8B0F
MGEVVVGHCEPHFLLCGSTNCKARSLDLSANESQLMDAMHGKEVDLLTLHRQVLRLNQRLRATEHAQEKSARREVLLCSAMTILLLINGWFWLRR